MITKIRSALPYIFLFVLAAVVLDLGNPLFDKPARDGGFFLYAGGQILNGKVPYLDFWDSKGPAIFFINALGLWVGGGSRWGVWIVEFFFIFATFILMYSALSKRWGLGAALFGVTLAGLSLRVALGYGNYTEEYALLFNAVGLYLFISMLDEQVNYKKYFWIGALFGLSFTFRANNIGGLFAILIAVFFYEIFKRNFTEALRIILATLAGFAIPLLLWILYFAVRGGAWDMIYASIIFNFSYSSAKDRAWLDLFGGFGKYGLSWYGWLTLAAWFFVVLRALTSFVQRNLSFFETYLLIWFPIEILLSNLSGRNFTHYYISWVLAVAVYFAFMFAHFWQFTFRVPALHGLSDGLGALISLALIVMLFLVFSSASMRYGKTISQLFSRTGKVEYMDAVPAYIRDNTQPNDLVLTWYPEMGVSFMAGRTSPVKYLYYPLFLEGSLTEEIESSYIADLKTKRPEMILDCSRSVDAIPSLDPVTRQEQFSTPGVKKKMYIQPGMEKIFSFVSENYQIENTINGCLIFRLNSQ
ncbi:MAG: glycosyltransferase family 39 protein [Anaerolineales bacterium]